MTQDLDSRAMMEWRWPRLPFFDDSHSALATRLEVWRHDCGVSYGDHASADLPAACRAIAVDLARHRLLDYAVPRDAVDADVRGICLIREALAFDSGLADTVFAMQGIGTAPLWRHPDAAFREGYLRPCREGRAIAAFAITEMESGSDVAAIRTAARQDGDGYVLSGDKAWISNAGIADHYMVIARLGEEPGAGGLSAFIIEAATPGLKVGPQIDNIAGHPLGPISLRNCRVPASALIGRPGEGFQAAVSTFNIFRISVGAAAVGFAKRALAETVGRVNSRVLFGKPMAKIEAVQARLADMVADTETAALAVYHAAWAADTATGDQPQQASLAKYVATEAAFRVVDSAVQMFGALGVSQGHVIERLYREIRPMRIYEGASEIQKLIIARRLLRQGSL